MKRYRAPKVIDRQIKMQKGKVDGEADMCIFYGENTPRCDRALVMNVFCAERPRLNLSSTKYEFDKSPVDELEERGYDLDTLKFSIERKI